MTPPAAPESEASAPPGECPPATVARPSRRTVARTAAWAAPALLATAAAPVLAASPACASVTITGLISVVGTPAEDVTLILFDGDNEAVDSTVTTANSGTNYVLNGPAPTTAVYTIYCEYLVVGWTPTGDGGSSITITTPPCERRIDGELATARTGSDGDGADRL